VDIAAKQYTSASRGYMNNDKLLLSEDIKSSVALEALIGVRSIEELAMLHNVPAEVIVEWKNDYMMLCRKNLARSINEITKNTICAKDSETGAY
jgi:hypothetical protein